MNSGSIAQSIRDQAVTAWSAPVPFLAALALAIFAIYWFLNHTYKTRIEDLKSNLSLKDAQVQSYKDKLDGASPDEAKARIDILEAKFAEIGSKVEALAPRNLNQSQVSQMVEILEPFGGNHVMIVKDAGSADSTQFSRQLIGAFRNAGWEVADGTAMGIEHPPHSGIWLAAPPISQQSPAQKAVAKALTSIGLKFDRRIGGEIQITENKKTVCEIMISTPLNG